jgi:hypothetical protein
VGQAYLAPRQMYGARQPPLDQLALSDVVEGPMLKLTLDSKKTSLLLPTSM